MQQTYNNGSKLSEAANTFQMDQTSIRFGYYVITLLHNHHQTLICYYSHYFGLFTNILVIKTEKPFLGFHHLVMLQGWSGLCV